MPLTTLTEDAYVVLQRVVWLYQSPGSSWPSLGSVLEHASTEVARILGSEKTSAGMKGQQAPPPCPESNQQLGDKKFKGEVTVSAESECFT